MLCHCMWSGSKFKLEVIHAFKKRKKKGWSANNTHTPCHTVRSNQEHLPTEYTTKGMASISKWIKRDRWLTFLPHQQCRDHLVRAPNQTTASRSPWGTEQFHQHPTVTRDIRHIKQRQELNRLHVYARQTKTQAKSSQWTTCHLYRSTKSRRIP